MRRGLLVLVPVLLAACAESSSPPAAPDAEVTENHPHALAISEPRRAAFIDATPGGDTVTIKGTGASKHLTVAGQPAEVASDGSFVAKIHATPGLNIIAAVDGDSRLETAFLYGHFVDPMTPVKNAVAISVGNRALNGALPDASLESVLNLALQNRELVGKLEGKTFSGENYGVTWSFEVIKGTNGPAEVVLNSAPQGIGIDASIKDVYVEGRLSMTSKAIDYTRGVKISIGKGGIRGDVDLAVDGDRGAITAAMPTAEAAIEDFKFDTDNAGFPCCVDSILTNLIQPKISDALSEAVRTKVPELVQFTLDGVGLPKKFEFGMAGFKTTLPISARFDGGFFDREGGTLTAGTVFGSDPKPGTKGWLALGAPYGGAVARPSGVSVSVALDALNQFMHAAWANGSLVYDAPAPLNAHLSVALPPVISFSPEGGIRVGIGEVLVQRAGADHALAAISAQQEVLPQSQGRSIVLTPKGPPTISVTWLADDSAGSGLNLVAKAAQEQVLKVLKPFAFPLPAVAMDAAGGGLMGHALVIDQPSVTVDTKQQRIEASGLLTLIK